MNGYASGECVRCQQCFCRGDLYETRDGDLVCESCLEDWIGEEFLDELDPVTA